MITGLPIKSLYELALAEGEGVGTAYEYYAKRLLLRPWLARIGPVKHMLIAGLPEKYGASLDFLQLADELEAQVTVVDERPPALEKLDSSLAAARPAGWYRRLHWISQPVEALGELSGLGGSYDLCLSSEVLQRLSDAERLSYVRDLRRACRAMALFAPNANNPAHTELSGLDGLSVDQLAALTNRASGRFGYLDMPPFPPGMTRTEAQRELATTGRLEALAMWALAYYARLERFVPLALRRRQAHIVYALTA